MHKSLPLLALIVTASISVGRLALAESRFDGRAAGKALIRARDSPLRQALAIARDLAGCGDPQRVAVAHDVADSIAEGP